MHPADAAAACRGKIAYRTFVEAWQRLMAMRRRHYREHSGQPYRCPHCHRIHLGNKK